MSQLHPKSVEFLDKVKRTFKDPERMKKIKAHILGDFAAFLYRLTDEELEEMVISKMEKGALERGTPEWSEEPPMSLHEIHNEREDEHKDLIGWYFVYLNARYDL